MGKRSNFDRNPRDYYITPEKAVLPLLPHIQGKGLVFAEPCAGDGSLVRHLIKYGMRCGWQSDIEPQHEDVKEFDALELLCLDRMNDIIITNPPWEKRKNKGEIFNKLLRHWLATFANEPHRYGAGHGDIWLLFDSDWQHTVQALEFKKYCKKIVSVGRVSWMGNGTSGKDNCSWYCFNAHNKRPVQFYWRVKHAAK